MKVLHVEGGMNLYGGAKQVQYLLDGLSRQGLENLLLVPVGSALTSEAWGSPVVEIPMKGDLDLGLIWRLIRIIRKERPDIVHLHSRRGADLLGGIATRLTGVRVVLSRRVDNPEPRWLVHLKYRLYDRVITISKGIYRVLESEGVPRQKLVCVPSAVDAQPFHAPCDREHFRAQFNLEPETRAIAVIAQLIPRKGHRYLLQVMPELLASFPTLQLLVFGKGEMEQEIRAQAVSLGITDKLIMAGFREDLPQILPCLDLVVHPALMEGLGIALLQAAAAGVPIVASDAGGIPEVVRDGVNGLLVPPADPEALVRAVSSLLGDRELAGRMGEAGRALVAREFSVERMVQGNHQVYKELVEDRYG